jgi:hypothetical protein
MSRWSETNKLNIKTIWNTDKIMNVAYSVLYIHK